MSISRIILSSESTESKMAADQSTDSTESVAVVLDVDAETTLGKSFDRTKIKKR